MKKVLFIDPNLILNNTNEKEFSLGLITIGGFLKNQIENLYSIDYFIPSLDNSLDCKSKIKKIINLLKNDPPDIIGCTTRCDSYPFTLDFITNLKKSFPKTVIVIGGIQATHTDVETMKLYPAIDYVVRGEGEVTFTELLTVLYFNENLEKVKGITYRDSFANIMRTQDRELLENLSVMPDYESIIKKNNGLRVNRIEAGRGCPYNCIFCSLCDMWKTKYRLIKPEEIVRRMTHIYELTKDNYFVLEHDNLLAIKSKVENLLNLLSANEKKFLWSCSARVDSLKKIDYSLLKNAGCIEIYLGIETGSSRMQKILRKNLIISQIYPSLMELNQTGISFTLSFMLGHPLERIEDIEDTVKLAAKCKTLLNCKNIQLHKLAPVSGSDLVKEYHDKIYINENQTSDQVGRNFPKKYLHEIFKNPKLFSSFYSFRLLDEAEDVIYNIFKYNWNELIQVFSRTFTYLFDEEICSPCILIMKGTVKNIINTIDEIEKNIHNEYFTNLYSFEKKLFEFTSKYKNTEKLKERGDRYNFTQNIIYVSEEILNFSAFFKSGKLNFNKKIRIRIWFDFLTNNVKYAMCSDDDLIKMNMSKNKKIVELLDKKTLEKFRLEGFII